MNLHFIFFATLSGMLPLIGFLAPQALPGVVPLFLVSHFQHVKEFFALRRQRYTYDKKSKVLFYGLLSFIILFLPSGGSQKAWGTYFKLVFFIELSLIAWALPPRTIERPLKVIFLTSWIFVHFLILFDAAIGQPLCNFFHRSHSKMYIQGGLFFVLLIWPVMGMLREVVPDTKYIIGLFILSFVTVLLMHSDTAPLALMMSTALALIPFLFFMGSRLKKYGAPLFGFACATVTFLTPFLFYWALNNEGIYRVLETFRDISYLHRLAIWKELSKKIFSLPFWGYGLESYRSLPPEIIQIPFQNHPDGFLIAEKFGIHPHNLPLHILYEQGFVGLFLISLLIGLIAFRCFKEENPLKRFLKLGCFLTAMFIFWVSVGAYQSWWISVIILAVALFSWTEQKKA